MAEIKQVTDVVLALQRGRGDPKNKRWGNAVFLIGAGCSASAGIPLARDIAKSCVLELAKKYSNGVIKTKSADKALKWLKEKNISRQKLVGRTPTAIFSNSTLKKPSNSNALCVMRQPRPRAR